MIGTVMLSNASSAPSSTQNANTNVNFNPEHVSSTANLEKVNGNAYPVVVNTISQMVHSTQQQQQHHHGKSYNVQDCASDNERYTQRTATTTTNNTSSQYYSSGGRARDGRSSQTHYQQQPNYGVKSYDQHSLGGSSSIVTNASQAARPSSKLGIIRSNNYQVHDMNSRSVNFGNSNGDDDEKSGNYLNFLKFK